MKTDLDPRPILASLGMTGVSSITPVEGGQDTAIWRVRGEGLDLALRLFRPDQRQVYRLEALAMDAARAAGIPVPTVHRLAEWNGRPVMLISWCPGRPMMAAVLHRPWQLWALAAAGGRLQAQIHRIAAPAELQRQRSGWLEWAGGSGDEEVQERLRALPLQTDRLLHLDYHPLNILMAGRSVTGVIDWTNAHAGDPRADLARTLTILRVAPVSGGGQGVLMATLRRLLAAGWLHGYTREAGPLQEMAPFMAWAAGLLRAEWAARVGRPGTGVTERDLAVMERWFAGWKRRSRRRAG